jgi:putative DNA-invertase from lambdoid prophage Rac
MIQSVPSVKPVFAGAEIEEVQLGQQVAIYCRVSTADQSCERQEWELKACAERAGFDVAGIWKEIASGSKGQRPERKKVMAEARNRRIDAIFVTELTRWGRSTLDLVHTLHDLQSWKRVPGRPDGISIRHEDSSGLAHSFGYGGPGGI